MTDDPARTRVIEVAREWLGSRYHHHAALKGVGADCATLLQAVYTEAGILAAIPLPFYSTQWFLHRTEERYLAEVLKYCREIAGPPGPGDIAVFKIGHCFAHGAIVVEWPRIIHAFQKVGFVIEDDALQGALRLQRHGPQKGKPREVRFFSPWGRPDGLDISIKQAGQRPA